MYDALGTANTVGMSVDDKRDTLISKKAMSDLMMWLQILSQSVNQSNDKDAQ